MLKTSDYNFTLLDKQNEFYNYAFDFLPIVLDWDGYNYLEKELLQ